jgi:hypothetical protein
MSGKRIILCVLVLFGTIHASAGSGFEFLRTSTGARPGAMGDAYVGGTGDLCVTGYNPAGLARLKANTAIFTYLNHYADFQGGYVGYGRVLSGNRVLAAGIAYMNYGSMEWTDITGAKTGSSSPGDFLFQASYAGTMKKGIGYGVSAKYIRSQIENYSADAMAVDAGLFYRIEKEKMNIGLSITNLGGSLNAYIHEKENLPLAYRLGLAKTLAHLPLTLYFQLTRFQFQKSEIFGGLYWALGGEFEISERFNLRWGYNSIGREQKVYSDKDRFTGISLGFGTSVNRFIIDYAAGFHGVLGSTHQFTVYMTL